MMSCDKKKWEGVQNTWHSDFFRKYSKKQPSPPSVKKLNRSWNPELHNLQTTPYFSSDSKWFWIPVLKEIFIRFAWAISFNIIQKLG